MNKIEEALTVIYQLTSRGRQIKGKRKGQLLKSLTELGFSVSVFDDLTAEGLITGENEVRLTPEGEKKANSLIRRQLLAERLFADVLEIDDREKDTCGFDHLISEQAEEKVCHFLRHPKTCPHGKLIPTGECCLKDSKEDLVTTLDKIPPKKEVEVAYILMKDRKGQVCKLMNLGIVPGSPLKLVQTNPSYIIHVNQTELAIDKDVAKNIYVRELKYHTRGD